MSYQNLNVGSLIILGIVLLAARALAQIFGARLALNNQERSEIDRICKGIGSVATGADAENLLIKDSGSGASTVANRVIVDAYNTGQLDPEKLDFGAYIEFARFVAGILVFLGLLGTVFGIATSVRNLSYAVEQIRESSATSTLNPDSIKNMTAGIDGLLSGMKSAFNATIAGLIATLVVAYYNMRFLAVSHKFAAEIETFVNRDVAHCRKRVTEAEQLATALTEREANTKTTGAAVNAIREANAKNALDAVNAINAQRADLQHFEKFLVTELRKVTGVEQTEALTNAAKSLSASAGILTKSVEPAVDRLSGAVGSTVTMATRVEAAADALATQLESTAHTVAENLTGASQALEYQVSQGNARSVELQGAISQTLANLNDAAGYFKQSESSLAVALKLFAEERSGVRSAADSVGESASQMTGSVRELKEHFEALGARQSNDLNGMSARIQDNSDHLEALLQRVGSALTDMAVGQDQKPVYEALDQIRRALDDQLRAVKDVKSASERQSETVANLGLTVSDAVANLARKPDPFEPPKQNGGQTAAQSAGAPADRMVVPSDNSGAREPGLVRDRARAYSRDADLDKAPEPVTAFVSAIPAHRPFSNTIDTETPANPFAASVSPVADAPNGSHLAPLPTTRANGNPAITADRGAPDAPSVSNGLNGYSRNTDDERPRDAHEPAVAVRAAHSFSDTPAVEVSGNPFTDPLPLAAAGAHETSQGANLQNAPIEFSAAIALSPGLPAPFSATTNVDVPDNPFGSSSLPLRGASNALQSAPQLAPPAGSIDANLDVMTVDANGLPAASQPSAAAAARARARQRSNGSEEAGSPVSPSPTPWWRRIWPFKRNVRESDSK